MSAPTHRLLLGDCREVLPSIETGSVQCVVTSPPYWGLRDYEGSPKQIGLEASLEEWVEELVAVFAEVHRVLRKDGTLWLNVGDAYVGGGRGGTAGMYRARGKELSKAAGQRIGSGSSFRRDRADRLDVQHKKVRGLGPKQLMGQPWRLAFALQEWGWTLRQDIVWSKPNPMPESSGDRCTKAHEYLFLLVKTRYYKFNADAISEPVSGTAHSRGKGVNPKAVHQASRPHGWQTGPGAHSNVGYANLNVRAQERLHRTTPRQNASMSGAVNGLVERRNKRSVWEILTEPSPYDHYATFPKALVRPCVLAGSDVGDLVLDPFGGTHTTGVVALETGRSYVGIEVGERANADGAGRLSHVTLPLALES